MALNGTLSIKQFVNGKESGLRFSLKYNDSGQNVGLVAGDISDGKNKLRAIYGDQSTYLASCSPVLFSQRYSNFEATFRQCQGGNVQGIPLVLYKGSRLLWQKYKKPANSQDYYDFTYFAMKLNQLTPEDAVKLPRTDSRFRPDMREMENGEFEKASHEKHRLEDKQREARAMEKKSKDTKLPKWFSPVLNKDEFGREGQWIFNGNYWKRQFESCADIY